ncbi:VWA domain-containing protein [Pseudomonas vancouverensis]|uniref:VWA domain-containing protein n=1 Tax=Pseudomonas vancouverensis TaxID=95300 RepID=UPI003D014EE9
MTDLHFLRPWWLIGVVFCGLLTFVARRRRSSRSQWHQVLDAKLASALIRAHAGRYGVGTVELLGLLVCLGLLALAGPTWSKQVPDELKDQAAVIIVLGNGNTMYAGDIAPNRNRAAKGKIEGLRRLMPQATFSVIAYATTAHLVIPPTRDDSFFELFLNPLEPDIMPATTLTHSGLGMALDLARQTAASAGMPANIILITDRLSARERGDLEALYKDFPSIEVLVVGTAEGGPLRFAPANMAPSDTGVSLDDFAALKAEGMPVTGISSDDQDLAWLQQNIRRTLTRTHNGDNQWHWQDSGYWLVLAMLPLGLLLKRQLRALSFLLPLVLLTGAYTPDARADWQDLWWTADQQGQQAMDNGDYARAAQRFTDPYRKGRAYYLAKDYPQAAAAFSQVQTAQGYFYLGNSLAQQQRYQAALSSYRQALFLKSDFVEARDNAKAMQALLDELAKHPGERQKAQPGDNDFSSIRIDLQPRQISQGAAPIAHTMSDDELNQWMANVKSSPRDMLKALFLLQTQERYQQEGR